MSRKCLSPFSHSFAAWLAAVALCIMSEAEEPRPLDVRHRSLPSAEGMLIEQSDRDLPVVGRADVVIAGGGVAGVAAALQVAQSDKSVVLIEQRNQLGYELTATYQCRASSIELRSTTPLARSIAAELSSKKAWVDQRVDPHGLRSYLHSRIAGQPEITTYLFSMPTSVVCDGSRVRGVVFSSHNGRQVVLAKTVIDATSDARLAVAAGAHLARGLTGTKTARRFIAIGRNETLEPGSRPMPESLGLAGNQMMVHDGFIEFAVRTSIGGDPARGLSDIHALTLDKSFAVRDALVAQGIQLGTFAVGPESWIDEMPMVVCRTQRSQQEIDSQDFSRRGALLPAGIEGLVVTGRIADLHAATGELATLLAIGDAAGQVATDMSRQLADFPLVPTRERTEASGMVRELLEGIEPGHTYPSIRQSATQLPVHDRYDVLVVGGGTSGAIAAIAAARHGARTAVVDVLPNLGGTSSNRVNSYYWGVPWKSRLRQELGDRIRLTRSTVKKGTGTKTNSGLVCGQAPPVVEPVPFFSSLTGPLEKIRFSGEDKKHALQALALQAGVTIYYQSLAVGAVVDQCRVTGVVVENEAGRHVLLGHVIIDATGHADIAVAAGAAALKGRGTDGFLHELEHGPLRDPTNPRDISIPYLRAPSPAISLNIRESRRIVGDYTVTFDDVIHQRVFPDTICRWRSNYDTHFPSSANQSDRAQDWTALLGLWRRPILGSIPYRSLLPQGLDGILVVAKAYSTDHDALVGGRMQSDLEHLGEAAGVAAAMACQANISPRQVPVEQLQAELVRLGVLRDEDVPGRTVLGGPSVDELHRQDLWREEREQQFPPSAVPRTLQEAIGRLGTDQALDGMVQLYMAGSEARPWLRPLLDGSDPAARDEAALVLGMLGDRSAVPILIEWLQQRNPRRFAYELPEASHRPSVPLYWSAVILLGRFGEKRALPAMIELLRQTSPEQCAAERRTNYNHDMLQRTDHCPPPLVSLIIVALGRIADPQAAGAIRPYLAVARRTEVREENLDFETAWAIRTNAAWALAQMGDFSGVPVLQELREADQAMLRDYASRLLEEIAADEP